MHRVGFDANVPDECSGLEKLIRKAGRNGPGFFRGAEHSAAAG